MDPQTSVRYPRAMDGRAAYKIEDTIEGHSRELYLVRRRGDQRHYIMAEFELRAEDREAVEAEIARCVELAHPCIVPVVDAFEDGDKLVLVFEKVDGVTLQRLLEHVDSAEEPLPDTAIFHIAASLFGALDAAHRARNEDDAVVPLVHAELGPHQVFVSWEGRVQLLGVGLSPIFRLAAAAQLQAPAAAAFVAPEILMGGALTVRANVYSAAAMIWALLARQVPPTDGSPGPRLIDIRPNLEREVLLALDSALVPSLIERRITANTLAATFEAHATGGDRELRWGIDVLKAIETFDESLFGLDALPSGKLSDVPAETLPPVVTLPPDDEKGFLSLPPPANTGVAISLLPASGEDPFDYDAPTIPPAARTPKD